MALEKELPLLELSNVSLSMPSQLYKSHSIGKVQFILLKASTPKEQKKLIRKSCVI